MSTLLKRKHALAASKKGGPFNGLVSTANLVSYWKLGEVSGNRIDSFGTNQLTPTNNPISAVGKIGNGCDLEFDSNQYLSIPNNSTFDLTNTDFTFMGWIKPETLPSFSLVIFHDAGSLEIRTESSLIKILINGVAAIASPILLNTWSFFVAWLDTVAGVLCMQVNNGTINQFSTALKPISTTQPFVIGARGDGSLSFDGIIDEFGFWKRVLTVVERTALYNSGNGLAF